MRAVSAPRTCYVPGMYRMHTPRPAGRIVAALLLAAGCLSSAPSALASPPTAESAAAGAVKIPVQRYVLPNGLRVVLNEDHGSPTVAICVTYDVGARNEQVGRSGFAHLFEHMMFQGSRNVGKGEHFTWVSSRGGTLNGTTSSDRTNYYEIFPSSGLATGLWLEADRMKTLAVTQDNFENQRKVVQEEYRMRISNAAYAMGLIKLQELVFEGYWPYSHPVIGSMADLDNAKLNWIREFHRSYYAPNNAVLAISGDFEPNATLSLVQRYFGEARRASVPRYAPPAVVPPQTEARVLELQDTNAKTPGVYLGWAIPPHRTPEHYALELAALILGYGDSSVLHQDLVQGRGLLQSIDAWTGDHRGPDLFAMRAILSQNSDLETVRQELARAVQRLAQSGPSQAEVAKAKQQLQSFFLFGLEGNFSRVKELANYELFWGDANLLANEVLNYTRVTPAQIQAAVQRYLTPSRLSTVVVQPSDETPSSQYPAPARVGATATASKEIH
jgi:zinc protease